MNKTKVPNIVFWTLSDVPILRLVDEFTSTLNNININWLVLHNKLF